MTGEELYALFIAGSVPPEQVAVMDFDDLVRHIADKRLKEPDDIGLSDVEIAMRIHDYAHSKADLNHTVTDGDRKEGRPVVSKFCNMCGTKLIDGSDECPTCGGGVTDEKLKGFLDGTLLLPGVDLFAGEGIEDIKVDAFGRPKKETEE